MIELQEGTPVVMIGDTEVNRERPRRLVRYESQGDRRVALVEVVRNALTFVTDAGNVAPLSDSFVPFTPGQVAERAQVFRDTTHPVPHVRRAWSVVVDGAGLVGRYDTKREGVAAAGIALAVVEWRRTAADRR